MPGCRQSPAWKNLKERPEAAKIAEPASVLPRPGRAATRHRTRPARARALKARRPSPSPRRTTAEPASYPSNPFPASEGPCGNPRLLEPREEHGSFAHLPFSVYTGGWAVSVGKAPQCLSGKPDNSVE